MDLDTSLRFGLIRRNRRGLDIGYRFLSETDDIESITELLHRAYAPLARAGMRYVASRQSADTTRRRMAKGDTILAVAEKTIIGTITLAHASATGGSPFYDRAEVASVGQFAVEPEYHGSGVGSMLLRLVEALAIARGVGELALDTSEHAEHLIGFYTSRGYRFIEFTRWPDVNYRSMVFGKSVTEIQGAI